MYVPTALPAKLFLIVKKWFFFASTVLSYWVYLKEDVETGATVKVITAGCLLGVVILSVRKAQVLFDSYTLISECEQVTNELENPMMDCLMYKHAVEDFLPEKKKILHVVKCKND